MSAGNSTPRHPRLKLPIFNSPCALTAYWDRVQAFRRALPYGHWERPSSQEVEHAAEDCFNHLTYLQVLRPSAVERAGELGLSPIEVGKVLDVIEAACRGLLHAVAFGNEGPEHVECLSDALVPLLDVLNLASRKESDAAADSELPDRFLDFNGKQQKLLIALAGNGKVAIDNVLRAVYESTSRKNLDALKKLKDRTNKALASKRPSLEIKKEGGTLRLQSV